MDPLDPPIPTMSFSISLCLHQTNKIMSFLKHCLAFLAILLSMHLSAQEIHWMSWEEAAAANDIKPRKIFVDVYTDWCGWCKRMDATTFKEADVISMINTSFYPVKLNAEQKETIHWKGQSFEWVAGGRDGINKLAYELLDGQMSYPTYVILDSQFTRILAAPGYCDGPSLLKELKFAADEAYKKMSWEAYKAKP